MLVTTCAAVLFALLSPIVTVNHLETRIDPVTGSMSWQTVWLFGIRSGQSIEPSPLETPLRRSGITWTRSPHLMSSTDRNIFGGATCYECGTAPPIYELRPGLKRFAAVSTDAELREFIDVMQSGSDAEKKAAVEAAGDKALASMSPVSAGN